MSVLRNIGLNLAILAAIGLQVDVAFAQVFSGLQRPAGSSNSVQSPNYFTIRGHIAHPNCYELPTASPSLVGFAQLAGDLTRTAGGSIRIVRDGRTVQSTFYTSKSSMRLVPGDIVVVDGKVNQGRIIHRGNQSPTDSDGGDVSLAITGVRDYPIVLIVPADRATIRWVTRQLGLDVRVASHVKAITQQQSVPVDPDSRLGTGTVLAFDPSQVDQSRLPDNLPVPVKAGRQAPVAAQLPSPMDPLAQQPLTDQHSGQYGAAPGRAVVPNIGPQSPAYVGPTETLNLPPEEQVFVKRLLTDPDSVPLDDPTPEPQGRAFVSPPMSQQRSISPPAVSSNGSQERAIADAPSNSTGVNEPAGRNSKPAAAVDAVARNTSSGAKAFSPEATRPYQSVPAVPEQLQPFGGARPGSAEVDSESEHSQAEPGAIASSSPGNAAEDSGNGGGFSFALQATGLAGTAAVAGTEQAVDNVGNVALTSAPSSRGAGPTPVMPDGNSLMQAGSTDMTSGSRGSRLLPPPPGGPNWPVVSICVVGLLGAIAASFLIYSIANENPAPRVTKVDTSGRY